MPDLKILEYHLKILEYLEKQGPANTFRLARVLGIDRHQLLNIIGKLEAKGAIAVRSGMVQFLKFPREEKVASEPERKVLSATPKSHKAKSKVLQTLQTENKLLKEKLSELKETMQELEQKASVYPKTITRTVIKRIQSPPKIITKVVTKNVPVIKTVIKKIPVAQPPFTTELWQKMKAQSQKLKISKFIKISKFKLLDNIQQLKKPEFVK